MIQNGAHKLEARLRRVSKQSYNKPKCNALTEDIQKLNGYLKPEVENLCQEMNHFPSDSTWRNLEEVTLVQVTVFNRRHVGQMERMKLLNIHRDVRSKQAGVQQEVIDSLSPKCTLKFQIQPPRPHLSLSISVSRLNSTACFRIAT